MVRRFHDAEAQQLYFNFVFSSASNTWRTLSLLYASACEFVKMLILNGFELCLFYVGCAETACQHLLQGLVLLRGIFFYHSLETNISSRLPLRRWTSGRRCTVSTAMGDLAATKGRRITHGMPSMGLYSAGDGV